MAGLPVGQPLPKLEAEGWLNGPGPTEEELAGKVVVIDAWAYWCGPCKREAPHLVQAYEKFKDQGVVFIGLTQEGEAAVDRSKAFLTETGITWPNGYGAASSLFHLQVNAYPTVLVFGRDGNVAWNHDSGGDFESAIAQALAAK